MSTATKSFSSAETTKLLKAELKQLWPDTKFSVTCPTNAVRVRYTDGPAGPKVQAIARTYSGATFDPMIDLQSYVDQTRIIEGVPTKVHYGVSFVFVERSLSEQAEAAIDAKFLEDYGRPYNSGNFDSSDDHWRQRIRDEADFA